MGSRVHYSEGIKWKAIQMMQEGHPHKTIMDCLIFSNIKVATHNEYEE